MAVGRTRNVTENPVVSSPALNMPIAELKNQRMCRHKTLGSQFLKRAEIILDRSPVWPSLAVERSCAFDVEGPGFDRGAMAFHIAA